MELRWYVERLPREDRAASSGQALRLPLIWIVDDSPTQAAITERALGDAYRFERFPDGIALIERVTATSAVPDLILLDWVMPGLSGDEVCRYLRTTEVGRNASIIILTASRTDTSDVVNALASGANDYVSKPFAPAELHARVETVLRAAQLKDAAAAEQRRLRAMNALANALLRSRRDPAEVLREVARWLNATLCDGCVLLLSQEHVPDRIVARHGMEEAPALLALSGARTGCQDFADASEALARLGEGMAPYVASFGVRAVAVHRFVIEDLAAWTAVLVRDGSSAPFDPRDVLAIQTALECTHLALEAALRSDNDRSTTRFHQEMVGIVSHDLRTPLAAVDYGIQILRNESLRPDAANVLTRLDRSSKRMASIVELLLDVTRARIGDGIPLTLERVSLRGAVERVVDEVRMSRPAARLEIRGDDVAGDWDLSRLEQVIGNLVGNAVQHGRADTPVRITISSAAGTALVDVDNQNRGGPISADVLSTIFDPFRRGERSGHPSGLGLGLYIAFQIVNAHRGAIEVTSDESGTRFRVQLPIAKA